MRVFVGMLAFNRPDIVERALKNFEATVEPDHRIIKTLFRCGYPLPSAEENDAALEKLGAEFGWWTPRIPNRGVMENWNVAIHEHFHMIESDTLVTFDPDVHMDRRGWLPAMIEVIQSDPKIAFCAAARRYHDEEWCWRQHGREIYELPLTRLRVARYRELIAWSMGMWRGEYLASRPRNFAAENPVYGYAEHADYARMCRDGMTWRTLVDYYDDHGCDAVDPLYLQWKHDSAAKRTSQRFEEWLAGRR